MIKTKVTMKIQTGKWHLGTEKNDGGALTLTLTLTQFNSNRNPIQFFLNFLCIYIYVI